MFNGYAAHQQHEFAEEETISLQKIQEVVIDQRQVAIFNEFAEDGFITIFRVSGDNIIVPSMTAPNHEAPIGLIHIKSDKCPLREVVTS